MIQSNKQFDLSERDVNGPKYQEAKTYYTDSEIEEKLKGYREVKKDEYDSIKYGSHVRYVRTDGIFRCGGFVTVNPIKSNDNKYYIRLRSDIRTRNKNTIHWLVPYDDIDKLYTKINPEYEIIRSELATIVSYNKMCFTKIIDKINRLNNKIDQHISTCGNDDNMSVYSKLTLPTNASIC